MSKNQTPQKPEVKSSIRGYFKKLANTFHADYVTGSIEIKRPIKDCTLIIEENGFSLKEGIFFFAPRKTIFLEWEQIKKINSQTQGQISRTPSMSGAAAGWLLLGPFGALAGASHGQKHDDREHFIIVTYKNRIGENTDLILKSRMAHEISNRLNERRQEYFINNNSLSEVENPKSRNNYLDELEKLADLRNKGIITKEEFEKKKKKLLDI